MKHWLMTLTLLLVGCMSFTPAKGEDIVETAVAAGNFKTLVTALKSAGLVDALKGDGPFTVFAPTDAAFANLPAGTVESLVKPENKATLTAILTYHVVPGKVLAEDVVKLSGAKTLGGQRIDIAVQDGTVMVDKSKVVTTDIVCSNGVIHVIDGVLLPSSDPIPAVADEAGNFKTLLAAVKAAGLAEVLSSDGPFTVFAPTDAAFGKLPAGTVQSLLQPENKQKLVDILKYHVVAGRIYSEDAVAAKSAKTLEGSAITVSVTDAGAMINNAKLVATDIDSSNGVIHVIDSVLMPPAKGAAARKILEDAVAHGAPLYNAGDHEACAKVYMTSLHKLMDTELDPQLQRRMAETLTKAEGTHCPTARSWALRQGIDHAYSHISKN